MSTNATAQPNNGSRTILLSVTLFVLLGGGFLGWLEWSAVWAWYDLRGLATATDADRDLWIERVASVDDAALPGLVSMMMRDEAESSNNARSALAVIVRKWGSTDGRSGDLSQQLAREYPSSGSQGRYAALALAKEICRQSANTSFGRDLLAVVQPKEEVLVLETALELSEVVFDQKPAEVLESVKKIVQFGLHSSEMSHRVKSVRLAMRPGLRIVEQAALLLNDPVPEVRRCVMLAVGSSADVVLDETLLPSLRDSDAEVRRLCEQALRARGLSDDHIRLSRLLVDPTASERLKVLDHLGDSADLEPGVWLRRLSHDPAPSVRASAVRVMALQQVVDLSDRLDQMARTDPSPSVSYLAQFYIKNALRPRMDR